MKYSKVLLISVLGGCCALWRCTAPQPSIINSPGQSIVMSFDCRDGRPRYCVLYRGDTIVQPSAMGFEFKDGTAMNNHFVVDSVVHSSLDEVWHQPWGENKTVRNRYNQMTVYLKQQDSLARVMTIDFRAFDDGVAFRYGFPKQSGLDSFIIVDERTEFCMRGDLKTWWCEADFDSYEKLYHATALSQAKWVTTPVTMQVDSQCYVSLHEAALTNYADMTLKQDSDCVLKAELVPWSNGDKVRWRAPAHTPWRTIQISPSAAALVESSMILNLNEPSLIDDVTWIKPMKYIGVWWGMHLGTQTWYAGARHGATTKNAMHCIDFAARHRIQGVVFEGWNAGWEHWGGKDAFDHITPAKDFDLQQVAAYAKQKGVMMIGHHETGGDIPAYEHYMEEAFRQCRELGIGAVKTGYAGGIYPRGEHHHGQFMVQHYRRVVEMAARYHIVLDVHEPIKDTGIRRTWPNMMTREGVRGMEWNAWSDGNPPSHTLIIPFTRGLAGPTDYTPGTFDVLFQQSGPRVKWNADDISQTRVHTTLAKQLANFVILYSPLQMASDLPANYEGHPAFEFISDYLPDTDETRVINGAIGEFITVARRSGEEWFLGSATNEEARSLSVSLSFLAPGTVYVAEIYRDADDAHWETNPTAYAIEQREVKSTDCLTLTLAAGGGQAIRFVKKH